MSPFLKKTSFDSKCVSLLEVTLQRIRILRNKRSIIVKQSRDDVAKLLQKGQDANAVARVEHAFRESNIAGAYDLLEEYCQLIIKHIHIIKSEKEYPPELKEAIASLIYAAPRCGDLQELLALRNILASTCGAKFSATDLEQRPEGSVNQQIIQKLSRNPPNSDTRLNLLKGIAQEYKIKWGYQKAVVASFKNGETLMEGKPVSKNPSQVSKGAISMTDTDHVKPPTYASAHSDILSKSTNASFELRDFVRANQASDVAQRLPVAFTHADALMGRARSVARLTADERVSRPNAFVHPIQVPAVSKPKAPERRKSELDRPTVQARSTQGIFQARLFSPKPLPPSISLLHETKNGNVESLAAKQYMRVHKADIKVDVDGEEDRTSMENSDVNMKAKHGAHGPHLDPYVRPRQGVMDYKKAFDAYEHVQELKRTPQAIDGEEDTSSYVYYAREKPKGTQNHAREQPKGTHYQRASNASIHGGPWCSKSVFSSQDRNQAEENYHRDLSMPHPLSKRDATRPSTHSDLNDDIADLEAAAELAFLSAARAADAAKAAIDMVRTSSMRLRADRKAGNVRASQREPYPKASFKASSVHPSTHAEILSIDTEMQVAPHVRKKMTIGSTHDLDHETMLYDTSIRKKEEPFRKQENDKLYTETHQEQEPVVFDSEMPHFDEYGSYESSEEEPPFHTKGRAATARKDNAP